MDVMHGKLKNICIILEYQHYEPIQNTSQNVSYIDHNYDVPASSLKRFSNSSVTFLNLLELIESSFKNCLRNCRWVHIARQNFLPEGCTNCRTFGICHVYDRMDVMHGKLKNICFILEYQHYEPIQNTLQNVSYIDHNYDVPASSLKRFSNSSSANSHVYDRMDVMHGKLKNICIILEYQHYELIQNTLQNVSYIDHNYDVPASSLKRFSNSSVTLLNLLELIESSFKNCLRNCRWVHIARQNFLPEGCTNCRTFGICGTKP